MIGIVLTISSYAQDILLPEQVVSSIIDELLVKDQLSFEVVTQDSIFSIYILKAANDSLKIHNLELTVQEYSAIIETLGKQRMNDKNRAEQRLKVTRRKTVVNFFKGFGVGAATAFIIIILAK